MAGGEFRFGTDSIYMARHQHRPPESTSAKIWITWLHYGCVSGPIASLFNTIAVFRRGKLGLGDTLRVNAQLVSGETGTHLWADRFDEPMQDLAAVQEEIVKRLGSLLGWEMVQVEAARSARDQPANPDAFDLFLRARSLSYLPYTTEHFTEA